MRYFLLSICLCAIPTFLLSQVDSFDIDSYARPDLRRETASFIPTFLIGNRYRENHNNESDNSFNFGLGGVYTKSTFINNSIDQIGSQINYGLQINFTKNKGDNLIGDDIVNFFNARPSFNIERSHKKFRNLTDKFFEYEIIGGINIDVLNFQRYNLNKISRQLVNSSFVAPIFVGKGRIELVNDYWHAANIFKALGQQNLLQSRINNGIVSSFATEISRIRNIRNTDGRLESIAEYEMICTYLIENNLVNSADYKFFAHLRDAWVFEVFINRFNGKEWKIGLAPQIKIGSRNDGNVFSAYYQNGLYRLNDFNYNFSFGAFYYPYLLNYSSPYLRNHTFSGTFNADNSHRLTLGSALTISYENRKSTSLNWQKDFFFNFQVGPQWSFLLPEDSGGYSQGELIAGNLVTNYRIYYIPNARSFYNLDFNILYQFDYEQDLSHYQGRLISNISGNYTKYLSPQFSWNLRARINYGRRQYYSDRASFDFSFSGGVNYRLY